MSKIISHLFLTLALTIYSGFLLKEKDGVYLRVTVPSKKVSKGLYLLQIPDEMKVPTIGLYVEASAKPVACPGRYTCLSVEKITPAVYDPRN
jgi:hypothetical protein